MEFPGEKLVIKLWETLAENGMGSLLKPWQIGREGRARNEIRRQEILMLAQADQDVADIRAGRKIFRDETLALTHSATAGVKTSEERIEPTLFLADAVNLGNRTALTTAARSEINASKAIIFAEDQLSLDAQAAPTGDVDEDWLSLWREHVGKVSQEDLQKLWGSVLAGEIKAPGSYSIRTMEFLKTLSKSEAEQISKLARYAIGGCVAKPNGEHLESKEVSFSTLLKMQNLGIISGVEAFGIFRQLRSFDREKFFHRLVSYKKVLILEHEDPAKDAELPAYALTDVGIQVFSLGSFEPDVEYLRLIGKDFVKKGFKVQLADWELGPDACERYFNYEDIVVDEISTNS